MVDSIESGLQVHQWLGGLTPSREDADAYSSLAGKAPSVATHPNAASWYSLVSMFTESVRASWVAGSTAVAVEKKGGKQAEKKAEPAQAAATEASENADQSKDKKSKAKKAAAAAKKAAKE